MVDENGYIKIIDFGMAKAIGQETSFDMYGTREYLAPEMVTKSGHDFSVDWWAVGILLYEMLIGITPFYQRTQGQLFNKIVNGNPVFPNRERYNIRYSDELQDLISNLLQKDPNQRLGT